MKHRELRLTPYAMRRAQRVVSLARIGLKERGDALVPAEGAEMLSQAGDAVYALFECGGEYYAAEKGLFYDLKTKMVYSADGDLKAALAYREEGGNDVKLLLSTSTLFRLNGDEFTKIAHMGGDFLAFYHERLFMAEGGTLHYTPPLKPRIWDTETEQAGTLPLPWQDGKIVALVPCGEKFYVFCERAVYLLTATGEEIDFRLQKLAFAAGEIAPSSAWVCRDAVLFYCTRGLMCLQGESFRLVRTAETVGRVEGTQTAASRGEYFVISEHMGMRCLYVYDILTDTDRIIDFPAETVAGGAEGVVCMKGNTAYRLTGSAEGGTLYAKLHVSSGDPVRIDSVLCDGEGTFVLSLKTAEREVSAALYAGKRKELPRTLYAEEAELSVRVPAGSRLCAVALQFREE